MKSAIPCLTAVLLTAACGGEDNDGSNGTGGSGSDVYSCEDEARAEPYTQGLSVVGNAGLTFKILSAEPAPPLKGDNLWVLEITDASGVPVVGATVTVKPFMPDHNHFTNADAIVTEEGEGRYEANPVNFMMTGFWEARLSAETESVTDSAKFNLCIPP